MNNPAAIQTVDPRPGRGGALAWAIGPAFCALAAWMVLGSPKGEVPVERAPLVDRERFTPGARRHPMTEPPTVVIGGYSHPCNECHRSFESPPVERRILTQHTTIRFDHGMNNRCFNCHDRANRERLVLHDGTLLKFDEVPRLCSQCHGTVFRDWQAGTHGKTMGSWDAASGRQHRLNCNDCHDPHAPAYPRIAPLPGPNTLRMGDQSPAPALEERHMPLRRWSTPEDGAPAGPPAVHPAEPKETGP